MVMATHTTEATMTTATKKMSVPGANSWVIATDVAQLRLRILIDGKTMPIYREQHARLYTLAAELERRSEGHAWVLILQPAELAGGDKCQMGIRIETATDSPSEAEAAFGLLKQIAMEIDRHLFRF
jgi:hypothetical protein